MIDVCDLLDSGAFGLSSPVHLMVADNAARRASRHAVCHYASGTLPSSCFVALGRTYYVSSPELMFVQLACTYSLIELIEIGYELCGFYTLDETDLRGFRGRDPLTSVARLKAFIAKAEHMQGVKRARRAVKYIIDRSESPRETHIAMLLSLPRAMGGYGLAQPYLNYRYENPDGGTTGKSFYRCDLCWPKAKLVIEYDSDLCHTGPDRISADSKKRGDLMLGDVLVRTVTNAEVMSAESMKAVAILVAKRTGKRVREGDFDLTRERIELRRALLHKSPAWCSCL